MDKYAGPRTGAHPGGGGKPLPGDDTTARDRYYQISVKGKEIPWR
jgi:hypothetical protein